MTRNAQGSVATIDQFIATVGQIKTASDGTTPLSEPGSIGGDTSHPVKRVDDRLEKAKEGERSRENSQDVKKDQGALSVENAPQASTKAASIFNTVARFAKTAEGAVSQPGSAADDHISTTTKIAPTGEDPAHETNSAKAGKEDKKQGGVGGTSHPASTENDQLDGHKYANDSLEKLATDLGYVGNELLAQIHGLYTAQGVQPTKQANYNQNYNQSAVDPQLAYYAGNELAGLVSGQGLDKRAADAMVRDALVEVIKQASDDADAFTQYARTFLKRASEPGEPMPPMGDPSGGMGGPPPGAGGPPEDAAMMASIGGGAGGGEGAEAGMGGGDEEAMMAALGGGAGGADAAGGGEEGGGDEAAELAAVLEQLGVTPEELLQEMQQQEGGEGGAPPAPPGGMETQASFGGGKRNAGTQKIARAAISDHIREIISRSRMTR